MVRLRHAGGRLPGPGGLSGAPSACGTRFGLLHGRLIGRCLIACAGLHGAIAAAQVTVEAPPPLDELLTRHLGAPGGETRPAALEAFRRNAQRIAADLLATEGYFTPEISVRAAPAALAVGVAPGPRATVAEALVDIRGPLSAQRREALVAAWPLTPGRPFRDADWRDAKRSLLRRLLAVDFPDASLADSRAEIDPARAEAKLRVAYESGPRYVFGPLRIAGLARYPPKLVEERNTIAPGDRYDQEKLLALQASLQRLPYFSSVAVGLAPAETASQDGVVQAPVEVRIRERAPHRLSFGAGYSTNTGARTEAIYQGFDFLHRAWQLDTGLRLEQLRQSVYADIRLPPGIDRQNGFGALLDNEDIQGQRRRRIAVGVMQERPGDALESRYAINWQREIRQTSVAPATASNALTLDGAWHLRRIDDPLDPRRGFVARLRAGGGTKALLSDQNFVRLYGRYEHFFPLGARDVASLRGELGATLAPGRQGIPDEFLFRAGGAQSVRGYAYQSLGVREGDAVVGGRYLATASAEYTHWFGGAWGTAVFVDAGNAADQRQGFDMALGYGIGARWKSPVGPLAVDLAYGQDARSLRLHFSLAVAF